MLRYIEHCIGISIINNIYVSFIYHYGQLKFTLLLLIRLTAQYLEFILLVGIQNNMKFTTNMVFQFHFLLMITELCLSILVLHNSIQWKMILQTEAIKKYLLS